MKKELSVLDTLEAYAHLQPHQRLHYYELNQLIYTARRLFWTLALGLTIYLALEPRHLFDVHLFLAIFLTAIPVPILLTARWIRVRFEKTHALHRDFQFMRLHSRLTHDDRF